MNRFDCDSPDVPTSVSRDTLKRPRDREVCAVNGIRVGKVHETLFMVDREVNKVQGAVEINLTVRSIKLPVRSQILHANFAPRKTRKIHSVVGLHYD
jgi:hypothetical protein